MALRLKASVSQLQYPYEFEIKSPIQLKQLLDNIRTPSSGGPRLRSFKIVFSYNYEQKSQLWDVFVDAGGGYTNAKLNYIVKFSGESAAVGKAEKYKHMLRLIRGKEPEPTRDMYIRHFAETILKLMKFRSEDLSKSSRGDRIVKKTVVRDALKTFWTIAVSEMLRDSLALPISYIYFSDLAAKTSDHHRTQKLDAMFNETDPLLPFVKSAQNLRDISEKCVSEGFENVFSAEQRQKALSDISYICGYAASETVVEESSAPEPDEKSASEELPINLDSTRRIIRKLGTQAYVAELLDPYSPSLSIIQPRISDFLRGERSQNDEKIMQALEGYMKAQQALK